MVLFLNGVSAAWLIIYDLKWTQSSELHDFKHLLNLNTRTFEEYSETDDPKKHKSSYNIYHSKSWFVRHKNTFGNEYKVMIFSIFACFCVIIWQLLIVIFKILNNNILKYGNLNINTMINDINEWQKQKTKKTTFGCQWSVVT